MDNQENPDSVLSHADESPASQVPGRRGRRKIYAQRRVVSLRLSPELHERMMVLCDELEIPFNTYLIDLIKADLARRGS